MSKLDITTEDPVVTFVKAWVLPAYLAAPQGSLSLFSRELNVHLHPCVVSAAYLGYAA